MKNSIIRFVLPIVFLSLLFSACHKENDSVGDDSLFCEYVNNGKFEATAPLIDNYLLTLGNNNTNLELLKSWLEARNCVVSVQILCNSCIKTYPAQSELRVVFNQNGNYTTLKMDIIMSKPLKFRTYHE